MRATAQAHPNIALVKYWGKRDVARNLPAVSSLSVTLDSLFTRTTVEFLDAAADDRLVVNGEDTPALLPRVSDCLDRVAGADRAPAAVTSEGNFPIAAGLASSASAFAALVVAANAALGNRAGTLELARAAGNASGSAARSLYGGIVELTALSHISRGSHGPRRSRSDPVRRCCAAPLLRRFTRAGSSARKPTWRSRAGRLPSAISEAWPRSPNTTA